VTRHILKGHGATVEVCENGEEAFQLVRIGLHNQREHSHSIVLPYDYILMDCEVKNMNLFTFMLLSIVFFAKNAYLSFIFLKQTTIARNIKLKTY
jgi:CheY-like chemotaxis protein